MIKIVCNTCKKALTLHEAYANQYKPGVFCKECFDVYIKKRITELGK
jgi:hypothetical protein